MQAGGSLVHSWGRVCGRPPGREKGGSHRDWGSNTTNPGGGDTHVGGADSGSLPRHTCPLQTAPVDGRPAGQFKPGGLSPASRRSVPSVGEPLRACTALEFGQSGPRQPSESLHCVSQGQPSSALCTVGKPSWRTSDGLCVDVGRVSAGNPQSRRRVSCVRSGFLSSGSTSTPRSSAPLRSPCS
jgi:hypothetical protein